ncbi:MAG: hypothetical protein NZ844_12895, partial [Chloroherpetonaceae bacterium]|nr:hypothetical protein [Chloroherpetonaceae bacterium]
MTSSALDSLPTLFPRLMPVRQWDLLTAVAAQSYTPSPPPLVGIVQADSGVAYRALGATDDAGLFYLLPKLVAFLNLPLNVVWALWFFGLLALALAAGIYSTLRLLQSPLAKALYLIELVVLTVLIVKVGDVYQLAPCLALVGVPLALQYFSKPIDEKRFRIGMAALVAAGVIFGWAHLIRAHSATAVLLFIGTLLLCATQIAWPKRGLLLAALIIGFVLPQVYMKPVFDARDSFLQARVGYRSIARQHPFWHSVYIGFGYLSNEYGLAY